MSSRLSRELCCCVSFWFWREIGSFFIVAGKFYYDPKKKSSSRLSGGLCCCVSFWFWREIGSFFVVAGKFYYDRKKKFKSSVWRVVLLCQFLVLAGNRQFFCCVGKVLLRPEKKVQVVCLAGCAVV